MKSFLPCIFCLCLLGFGGQLRAQQSNQAQMPADAIATGGPAAGQAAADVWLGLMDDGQYDKSWQTTSGLFQKFVPQDRWATLTKTRRAPLGRMLSRTMKSATFMKALPNAPVGQYVVVDYSSSFEHKKTAVETVTATLDKDGQWRVSGYFVR